jgi:predicted RNase H-like nuclease (RuvC/YqgF family)
MGEYVDQLQEQLEESREQIVESKRRATMLERNSRIDDDATSQLKKTLSQAQNEVLELKKELAFYKSIVAPEQGARNIAIETVELNRQESGGYQYRIMAVQRGRNDQFARGTVEITIEGEDKGKQSSIELAEVSREIKKPQKFGFKYFQNFEGEMNLPETFKAKSLRIKMKPSTDKIKAIDEQYVWSDLTAGGA